MSEAGGACRTRVVGCDAEGVGEACRRIAAGEAVAFPTDTVYGLGCDPFSERAVDAVYAAKGRPPSKPLPVLGASAGDLGRLAGLEGRAARLAARFWPGPLTILARAAETGRGGRPLARRLVSGDGMVAVRVPDSACAFGLLGRCGPLAGTSANLSGLPPCATAAACLGQLGGRIPLIVDGGPTASAAAGTAAGTAAVASTIVRVDAGGRLRVVRAGPVSEDDLERIP